MCASGFIEAIGLAGVLLATIPSIIIMVTHSILYIIGRRYREREYSLEGIGREKITVIIPTRLEPLDLLDDALRHLYSLGLGSALEVIVVSDDPINRLGSIREIVGKWREKGLDTILVWRSESRGYKAGALNTGLWLSTGDYLYVMDIDNRFSREALFKAIGLIKREGYDAVVIRWCGSNRSTRVSEAVSSSMDYIVDSIYRGRACLGLPLLTVGTGTVFKTEFLKEKLRGWSEDCILEDIDAGVRTICINGRVGFVDKPAIHVGVPEKLKSFRVQQERWAYGATDVAIKRFRDILFSRQPLYSKIELLVYLLQYTPVLSTLAGVLLLSITLVYRVDPFREYIALPIAWTIASLVYGYAFTDSQRRRGKSLWRSLVSLGRISSITTVLSPTISWAILKAIARRKLVFKRTPKGELESRLYGLRAPVEIILAAILAAIAFYGLYNRLYITSLWILFYLSGYYYSIARWWRDLVYK